MVAPVVHRLFFQGHDLLKELRIPWGVVLRAPF